MQVSRTSTSPLKIVTKELTSGPNTVERSQGMSRAAAAITLAQPVIVQRVDV